MKDLALATIINSLLLLWTGLRLSKLEKKLTEDQPSTNLSSTARKHFLDQRKVR